MSEWTTDKCPGYRSKTIQHGACTIIIHRPELDDKERAKRETQVQDILSRAMRDYIRRTA